MSPEKLKRSLRRFRRRGASLRRRMATAIQDRSQRSSEAQPVYRRGVVRSFIRHSANDRPPTRQELQHYADWQQSRIDIGLS